jgi:hypothetical protein
MADDTFAVKEKVSFILMNSLVSFLLKEAAAEFSRENLGQIKFNFIISVPEEFETNMT